MIIKVCWISFLAGAALCAQSGVEGTWQGTLDVGAIKLRLGLHVSKNAEGQFTSKLDSIDQSAMGIPVKVTTFADNALHLELPNLHATYDGKLSADGSQISGTFVQGAPVPLVFRRVEKVETLNRPQNPKPPYPYDAQDVAYETSAGIKLAGTLKMPLPARIQEDLQHKNYDAEVQKYTLGTDTNQNVVIALQAWVVAQSSIVTSQVNLRTSILNLYTQTGELLDERGIIVK